MDQELNVINETDLKKEKKEKRKKEKQNPKRKKKVIRRVIIAVVLLLIIGFFVISSITAKSAPKVVTTTEVLKGDISAELDTSGTIKSEITRTYYACANTNIGKIDATLGTSVSTGQQLITYDNTKLEFNTQQSILQSQADAYNYKSIASVNATNKQILAQASIDVANYQALMANQNQYVKNLEDSISDETVKQRADLYAKQYDQSKARILFQNRATDTSLTSSEIKTAKETLEKIDVELNSITNQLALLADYKTEDNREDVLVKAKKDASDLEIAYNEVKAKKEKAEAAILDDNKIQSYKISNEISKASGENANTILENAKKGVVADFNGIVTAVSAKEGAPAVEGTELLTIESSDDVKVAISVSKYDLADLEVGQDADVKINSLVYKGKVSNISKVAVPNASGTPMVAVEIHIENPDEHIFLGLEAKITVHTAQSKGVLLVPIESVNADTKGDFCYVVKDGIVVRKAVTIGISSDKYVEVKEGLSEGEQVITVVASDLEAGNAVTTVPAVPAE